MEVTKYSGVQMDRIPLMIYDKFFWAKFQKYGWLVGWVLRKFRLRQCSVSEIKKWKIRKREKEHMVAIIYSNIVNGSHHFMENFE